jgi:hypothetical protein
MSTGSAGRLMELRRERDRTRSRLIELELEIASMITTTEPDVRAEIADAEERGDWLRAAQLRAAAVVQGSAVGLR